MSWLARNRLPYVKEYRSYAVTSIPGHDRQDIDHGGKVILPPSALEQLTRLNTAYPMFFKLTNSRQDRQTHCGVLEFIADEGRCYIPTWMMRNLQLEEGNTVKIQSVSLSVANFSKFEPQSSDFLDISNPKAVLENELRYFACLTAGDVIEIRYNNKNYRLKVLETRPDNAVSIIECDMDVDFAAPADYIEPIRQQEQNYAVTETDASFRLFGGSGNRLDGKAAEIYSSFSRNQDLPRGIPDYEYQAGNLRFVRQFDSTVPKAEEVEFKAFTGKGQSLAVAKVNKSALEEIREDLESVEENGPTVTPSSHVVTPFLAEDDFDFFWDYNTPFEDEPPPTEEIQGSRIPSRLEMQDDSGNENI